MSIFEKIKNWWTARREAKRAWWLEPTETQLHHIEQSMHMRLIEDGRKVFARLDEIERTLKHRFGALDLKCNALQDAVAAFERDNHGRHSNLLGQVKEVKQELEGIRSRYHWVEERYHEVTKTGVVPREFNYQKRQ